MAPQPFRIGQGGETRSLEVKAENKEATSEYNLGWVMRLKYEWNWLGMASGGFWY
jgi:hypothetical protein